MLALRPLSTGSLSARIRLLILVATLPAVALVAYEAQNNRTRAVAAAREDALSVTRAIAYSQQRLIDNTRTFLQALALTGQAQNLDSPQCSQYLAEILSLNSTFVNVGIPRADGELICNATPFSGPVNVANRTYFQRAMREREFTVGTFQIDRVVNVASVNFAQPVFHPKTKSVIGVAVAVVSLDWWSRRLQDLGLPDGAVARVTDAEGRVIARFPPDANELGAQLAPAYVGTDSSSFQVIIREDGTSFIELTRPLLESSGKSVADMRLSMPLDALYEKAAQQMRRDIGFLLAGLLLSFLLSHEGVRRGVTKPLARLLDATDRLAQGRQVASIPETGYHELALLAHRFNVMATARQQAEIRLRLSEENLSITLHSIGDAVLVTDDQGQVVRMNGVAEQLTGWSLSEAIGRPLNDVFYLTDVSGRKIAADSAHRVMTKGIVEELSDHPTLIARDGSDHQVAGSVAPIRQSEGHATGVVIVFRDVSESIRTRQQLEYNEARFRTLTNLSSDWYWEQDPQSRFIGLFGHAAEWPMNDFDLHIGKTRWELAGPDADLIDWGPHFKVLEERGEFRNFEYACRSDDGSLQWLCVSGTPIFDIDGCFKGYRGVGSNITARKNAEKELRIAAIAFDSQEGLLVADAGGSILRVNRAFTRITGYESADAVGRPATFFASGCHNPEFDAEVRDALRDSGEWSGEVWNRCKNGEVNLHQTRITAVHDTQGQLSHYVASLTDITQKVAAAKEIEYLAFYDPLTQLPNRRLLLDRLQQAIVGNGRSGNHGALLCLDLDRFKNVNDTLGHDMGNVLLQQTADRLTGCVREGDTVARLGGDEFLLLLKDMSTEPTEAAEQTQSICAQIVASLNQPYRIALHRVHSTSSIGAVLFSGQGQSVDELMKRADLAMYAAKAAGRNALRFFDPRMQAAVTARAALENDLRSALSENQFRLHYQVQVGISGYAVGAEVLVRWLHPERGLLAPAEFIPLAEETGQISLIGMWVLRTACQQLRCWQDDPGGNLLQLAVNVSARQFRQSDFVDQVCAVLSETGAQASRLKLELTESVALDDVTTTIAKMSALRKLGIGFSMDDFGTGQSSLSYLTRLPLDQLKIDQSFVRNIGKHETDALIVQTIIGMARSLKIDVIAEGVETVEQRDFLAQHGCTLWQGYLFSRPVPLEDFEQAMGQLYRRGSGSNVK